MCVCVRERERERGYVRERERERQRDRDRERQTETERQTDREMVNHGSLIAHSDWKRILSVLLSNAPSDGHVRVLNSNGLFPVALPPTDQAS